MQRLEIKICGITTVADAIAAVDAGADYIGLIFVGSSSRYVAVARARDICTAVHGRAKIVGVFQDAPVAHVEDLKNELNLDYVQLHGNESPEICKTVAPSIKAIATLPRLDLVELKAYGDGLILFDKPRGGEPSPELIGVAPAAAVESTFGLSDFAEAVKRSSYTPSRFLYAGGLTIDNIAEHVDTLRLLKGFVGVDVDGGTESSPGIKDHQKLKLFCQRAKEAYCATR